jgi:serine protease Do
MPPGARAAGGVSVAAVDPRSPAARSGVKPGDVVISFDGEPVTEPAALVLLLLRSPVGAEVPMEILRDGTRQTITVTVGRRPHER